MTITEAGARPRRRHRPPRATAGRRLARRGAVLRVPERRGRCSTRRSASPGPDEALEPDDLMLLVLGGQAPHGGGDPPAVGAGQARPRRPGRRVRRRLGRRQGEVHDPPRAHAHRRLPERGRQPVRRATCTYDEVVAHIAASPARWEPGTDAAYHPSSGWKILGAIVERVDGRPIDRYLREEVFGPIGLENMRLGIPRDEQARPRRANRSRALARPRPAGGRRGRQPADGPLQGRPVPQRAALHRQGRARRRDARARPRARPVLRIAARLRARACSTRARSR